MSRGHHIEPKPDSCNHCQARSDQSHVPKQPRHHRDKDRDSVHEHLDRSIPTYRHISRALGVHLPRLQRSYKALVFFCPDQRIESVSDPNVPRLSFSTSVQSIERFTHRRDWSLEWSAQVPAATRILIGRQRDSSSGLPWSRRVSHALYRMVYIYLWYMMNRCRSGRLFSIDKIDGSITRSIYHSMYVSIYLSLYHSIYHSIYLAIYLSIYLLYVYLLIYLYCLSIDHSMYVCMYVCMHVSIYLSIDLCIYIYMCVCQTKSLFGKKFIIYVTKWKASWPAEMYVYI